MQIRMSEHTRKVKEALHQLDAFEKRNSPKFGDVLRNLAGLYYDAGQFKESEKWERKALHFFCNRPDDVNKYARTMYNLAITLSRLNRSKESVELEEKCIALYRSFLPAGRYHEPLGLVMDNLAIDQFLCGNHEQALRMSKQALAYYRTHLPPDHPRIHRASQCAKKLDLYTSTTPILVDDTPETPPVAIAGTTKMPSFAAAATIPTSEMITTTTTPPVPGPTKVTSTSTTMDGTPEKPPVITAITGTTEIPV